MSVYYSYYEASARRKSIKLLLSRLSPDGLRARKRDYESFTTGINGARIRTARRTMIRDILKSFLNLPRRMSGRAVFWYSMNGSYDY